MNNQTHLNYGFRISLRQMLLAVAAIAVGCAALKYANQWWVTMIFALTILAFMASAIVALVDRGLRQAYALGFVICSLSYVLLLFKSGINNEMEPYEASLPTSTISWWAFESSVTSKHFHAGTGIEIQDYDPELDSIVGTAHQGVTPAGGRYVTVRETPSRSHFMTIGHCLWALLLGTIGGCFARFVYARRMAEENSGYSVVLHS